MSLESFTSSFLRSNFAVAVETIILHFIGGDDVGALPLPVTWPRVTRNEEEEAKEPDVRQERGSPDAIANDEAFGFVMLIFFFSLSIDC